MQGYQPRGLPPQRTWITRPPLIPLGGKGKGKVLSSGSRVVRLEALIKSENGEVRRGHGGVKGEIDIPRRIVLRWHSHRSEWLWDEQQ